MTQKRTFYRQGTKPKKKSAIYLSPTPISKYKKDLDETGEMLTFMAPIGGIISNCVLFIGNLDDDASAIININSSGVLNTLEVPVKQGLNTIDTDFNVLKNDRIILKINTTPSEATKDFWLSFTFMADPKDTKKYINGIIK